MSYRSIVVSILFVFSTTLIGPGCSSTPVKDDGIDHLGASTMDAVQAFEAAAKWLPADAGLVVVGAGEQGWESVGEGLLPTANPNAEPGSLGTLKGVRNDLEEVLKLHFGFDPMRTEAAAAGVSLAGGTMVLFGDFEEPTSLPEIAVNDRSAYALNFGDLLEIPYFDMSVMVMPIDEPRRGLVITMDSDTLEELDSADGGTGTLAFGVRGQMFSQLFEDAKGASLAMASPIGEYGMMFGLAGSIPEAVMISYGDSLGLTMQGAPNVLSEIEKAVEDFVMESRGEVLEEYQRTDHEVMERLFVIYGYHFFESIAGQLHPRVSDERLHYEVSISDIEFESLMVVGSLISAGWFLFVGEEEDEYEHVMQEIEFLMQNKSETIAGYFETEQSRCDGEEGECDQPWHAFDEDDDDRENTTVPENERVFPGGTNVVVQDMSSVPENLQMQPTESLNGADSEYDGDVEFLLNFISMSPGDWSLFRTTYTTGPGTGIDATATITMEANFNPATPVHHTVVQEIIVDPTTGKAVVLPMYTEHQYQ